MTRKEFNDYVETMKPILYLLKLTSILPFPYSKDDIPTFLASRIVWCITMAIFLFMACIIQVIVVKLLFSLANHRITMKVLIITMLRILGRMSIWSAPMTTWYKGKSFAAYWTKWKVFQNNYKLISGNVFESRIRKRVKFTTTISIVGWLWTSFLLLAYVRCGLVDVTYLAECFALLTIYLKGVYWYLNVLYLRSAAEDVIKLAEVKIIGRRKGRRLHHVSALWLTLCDLDKEFYNAHSFLFLIYFVNINVGFIFFAFIGWNHLIFEDIFNRWIQLTGILGCAVVVGSICETAYAVDVQFNQKTKEILLQKNTINMDEKMLHSLLHFLQITEAENPERNLNGFVVITRSFFPTIWSIVINYLIILRQFSR